jgi:hypothetical protein
MSAMTSRYRIACACRLSSVRTAGSAYGLLTARPRVLSTHSDRYMIATTLDATVCRTLRCVKKMTLNKRSSLPKRQTIAPTTRAAVVAVKLQKESAGRRLSGNSSTVTMCLFWTHFECLNWECRPQSLANHREWESAMASNVVDSTPLTGQETLGVEGNPNTLMIVR